VSTILIGNRCCWVASKEHISSQETNFVLHRHVDATEIFDNTQMLVFKRRVKIDLSAIDLGNVSSFSLIVTIDSSWNDDFFSNLPVSVLIQNNKIISNVGGLVHCGPSNIPSYSPHFKLTESACNHLVSIHRQVG